MNTVELCSVQDRMSAVLAGPLLIVPTLPLQAGLAKKETSA